MSSVAVAEDANKAGCKAELEKVGANPPPGAFAPNCTEYGFYSVRQVHGSTGFSWCVNPMTGAEINGTKTPPGTPPVDCPPCLQQLAEGLAMSASGGAGGGASCDEQGHYTPLQASGSTGHSWCADPITGQKN